MRRPDRSTIVVPSERHDPRIRALSVTFALACATPLPAAQVVPRNAPPPVAPAQGGPRQDGASPGASGASAPATPPEIASPEYPDDPRLRVALRMLGSGNMDFARMTAATVLAEKPECDRAAAIQGIALNKMKRYEEARPFLDRARRSSQPFPEQRHAAHFLGWCCYHLGQLEEARAAFEQHLAAVPGEPDSTFGLGVIALDEDRLEDAERSLQRALDGFTTPEIRRADQARVLVRMSDLALRRDDVPGAEALLRRAIEASAVQHETWSKLARVCDRLGKQQEADAARANAERILVALGRKSGDGSAPATVPQGAPNDGDAQSKDAVGAGAQGETSKPEAPKPETKDGAKEGASKEDSSKGAATP